MMSKAYRRAAQGRCLPVPARVPTFPVRAAFVPGGRAIAPGESRIASTRLRGPQSDLRGAGLSRSPSGVSSSGLCPGCDPVETPKGPACAGPPEIHEASRRTPFRCNRFQLPCDLIVADAKVFVIPDALAGSAVKQPVTPAIVVAFRFDLNANIFCALAQRLK